MRGSDLMTGHVPNSNSKGEGAICGYNAFPFPLTSTLGDGKTAYELPTPPIKRNIAYGYNKRTFFLFTLQHKQSIPVASKLLNETYFYMKANCLQL